MSCARGRRPAWSDPSPRAHELGINHLAATLQRPFHLPLGVAVSHIAPFVPLLLAAGDRELDLDAAVLEVEPRRDDRQALLTHLAVERVDLAAMQEELPRTHRLVVGTVSLVVGGALGARHPR